VAPAEAPHASQGNRAGLKGNPFREGDVYVQGTRNPLRGKDINQLEGVRKNRRDEKKHSCQMR